MPVSPQTDAAEWRLHIHGIKEMPAGYDAEVAELFRDLRSATTLSEHDLAARLGTRSDVVQALEQGALYALPPWPETCRVVNGYGALLNLDVRPLLRRIYAQLEAGIVELQPKAMPDVPVMTPPETRDYGFAGGNHSGGGQSPNPLDIPFETQAPPPRRPAPNAQGGPPQQAPWPNAQAAPRPHPQPNAWPNAQAQPLPQAHPQSWPGKQQAPRAPQPAPAPRPAPQPQVQRAPQPRPQQMAAPQAQPQPQPQPALRQAPSPPPPQPQVQAQPQPQPQPKSPLDVDFTAEPLHPAVSPAPEKKRRRSGLLKWGLVALMISIIGFGLWFALDQAQLPSGIPGVSDGQSGALDPDDPRSRKQDRLPDASQPIPPQ